MVLSPKLKEYEDDNIVRYGVSVPVAGVRDASREIRDIALVMGAMLNLPKPSKAAVEAPVATDVPVAVAASDGPAPA